MLQQAASRGTEAAEPFHDVGHSEFALEQPRGLKTCSMRSMGSVDGMYSLKIVEGQFFSKNQWI